MSRVFTGLVATLALLGVSSAAQATVVFSGSSNGLSASASFNLSGNTLTILLTNTDAATGAAAPDTPAEVLSGLYFNLGSGSFTPVSASVYTGPADGVIQPGSIIQTSNCDTQSCAGQTNIGGEWSYASGGAAWLAGTNQGISSAGYLNANTSAGNFNGPDYENPASLNGIEFGIVPKGWVEGSGNGGLDNSALIAGTAQFVLELPGGHGLTENDITNVYFTYGTKANENTVPGGTTTTSGVPTTTVTTSGVPEPTALSVLGLAMAGLAVHLRRRRQSS